MAEYDTWRPWPIWSAVWVGALAAIAVGLIIGLIGFAVGAHELAAPRFTSWNKVRLITSIFNICGAFFAFVVGGWVAARIAGLRRAEPAMLHGGVVWLLTIPMMLVFAALGATSHRGCGRAAASRGVREDNHGARSALAAGRSAQPDHPAVPARRRALSRQGRRRRRLRGAAAGPISL